MANLLTDLIMDKSLISESQWGFLSGRSTTLALLSVTESWHKYFESGTGSAQSSLISGKRLTQFLIVTSSWF